MTYKLTSVQVVSAVYAQIQAARKLIDAGQDDAALIILGEATEMAERFFSGSDRDIPVNKNTKQF